MGLLYWWCGHQKSLGSCLRRLRSRMFPSDPSVWRRFALTKDGCLLEWFFLSLVCGSVWLANSCILGRRSWISWLCGRNLAFTASVRGSRSDVSWTPTSFCSTSSSPSSSSINPYFLMYFLVARDMLLGDGRESLVEEGVRLEWGMWPPKDSLLSWESLK